MKDISDVEKKRIGDLTKLELLKEKFGK
jgi:hypothetical protein